MTKLFTLLILAFSIAGCATKGVNTTMFLKETDRRFYNLKGHNCSVSGYEVKPNRGTNTYRLVTTYINCEVHEERTLEEFELKDWGVKPKGKMGIN